MGGSASRQKSSWSEDDERQTRTGKEKGDKGKEGGGGGGGVEGGRQRSEDEGSGLVILTRIFSRPRPIKMSDDDGCGQPTNQRMSEVSQKYEEWNGRGGDEMAVRDDVKWTWTGMNDGLMR